MFMKLHHVKKKYTNKTTYNRSDHNKNNPYTIISNKILEDKNLDYMGRLIMLTLLSHPDNWVINKERELRIIGCPHKKFNDAWKQLERLHYITRKRILNGTFWVVNENPNVV